MNDIIVYIASPLKFRELNENISKVLEDKNIYSFLPHTINLPDELDHLKVIGDTCFDNIDKANIVIAVSPFGLSTASEIGYAINRKRKGENLKIVLFEQEVTAHKRIDATLCPYFDATVHELNQLTKEIIRLQRNL